MTRTSLFRGSALSGLLLILSSAGPAWADTKASAWTNSAGRSYDYSNPRFRMNLPQAQTVVIDLKSSVDTYLYVLTQQGVLAAQDDDSGGSLNSRVSMSLPAGKYTLIAATYSAGKAGDFTISVNNASLSGCFVAFVDAYYGGGANVFCDGSESGFQNDTYSSFRVPRGMRLQVHEHSNFSGLSRTYSQDVPWVGTLYNDMISSIRWWNFSGEDFFMLVSSDPQFSWGYCSDDPNSSLCQLEKQTFSGWTDEAISRRYNWNLVNAMNTTIANLGDYRVGGVIVNGDLTEFGDQGPDLDDYVTTYEHGLKANVYLGLGNHDYANNVDDCAENGCASTMVWYLKDQVPTLNPVSFDYSQSGTYYQFPSYRRDHSGSLGYSWDIGNVHFVQLNNYPTYTRSWNGWNFSAARRDYFSIFSALTWLWNDLQNAASHGRKIVLNFHDWGSARSVSGFTSMLDTFPVSAVNVGHWHDTFGRYEEMGPMSDGKKVPTFISGSAHYGTFLVERFVNGKVYVWQMVVDHFNGAALRVLYNNTFYSASNTAAIFDVTPGASRYYQYVYDLR